MRANKLLAGPPKCVVLLCDAMLLWRLPKPDQMPCNEGCSQSARPTDMRPHDPPPSSDSTCSTLMVYCACYRFGRAHSSAGQPVQRMPAKHARARSPEPLHEWFPQRFWGLDGGTHTCETVTEPWTSPVNGELTICADVHSSACWHAPRAQLWWRECVLCQALGGRQAVGFCEWGPVCVCDRRRLASPPWRSAERASDGADAAGGFVCKRRRCKG
jgi:hypothetical protein